MAAQYLSLVHEVHFERQRKGQLKSHSKGPADSGGHPYGAVAKPKAESHLPKHTSSAKCGSCARDSHGRIERSSTAKHDFQRSNPCPSTRKTSGTCPGYVIDHRQALKHGGADAPSNMQWQTTAEAKTKDRVE